MATKHLIAQIQVDMLGLDTPHDMGFIIDRPRGWGTYLLQRFHTPMELLIDGVSASAEPGDCILYEPTCPQRYQGRGVRFRDDWMHIQGRDMGKIVREFRLPLNRVFRPASTTFMTPLFETIQDELHGREIHWRNRTTTLLVEILLLLSRHLHSTHPRRYTATETEHLERFRTLRREVQQTETQPWTVERMANQVHLSPSRFSALYRKFFGLSPMEDLLRRRIQEACRLLANTAMPVSRAAELSGFTNVYYFSRQFHKRVGCAPRDYYRSMVTQRA